AAEPHEEWISVGKIEVGGMDTADGEHVARWSPARVLADCEAKRRSVDLVQGTSDSYNRPPVNGIFATSRERAYGELRLLEVVLASLAQPYADHPDYDPAWSLTRD